jgi:hypothetical protein
MKLQHFILAGLLSLIFVSCNLEGRNEATPTIDLRAFIIETDTEGRPDTVFLATRNGAFMIQRGENIQTATFDTVSTTQVVHFQTWVFSQFSPVKEYRIRSNRETAPHFTWSSWQVDSIRRAFNENESVLSLHEANLVTRNVYHGIPFNFLFEAPQADRDLTLVFTILNGGSRDYNTGGFTIRMPIRN